MFTGSWASRTVRSPLLWVLSPRAGDWGGGQGEGVFNPHPLQGKVLLVTFGGQAVTHKLQLQGHMGEQDQEFLKGREDESGSHPVFTSTPLYTPLLPSSASLVFSLHSSLSPFRSPSKPPKGRSGRPRALRLSPPPIRPTAPGHRDCKE